MIPLLACSLIALTVIFERAFFWLRERQRRNPEAIAHILALADNAKYEDAVELGRKLLDWRARILTAGLSHRRQSLEYALEMAIENVRQGMARQLNILGTIITLSPLLGIFGTVTGLIKSFDLLHAAGLETPAEVTGGIAEALITTAVGLAIAMVSLIPYNYYQQKVEAAGQEMERLATQLQMILEQNGSRDGS